MKTKPIFAAALVGALAFGAGCTTTQTRTADAQPARYDELANLPFKDGYIAKDNTPTLLDDLFFQRAAQTYLWAIPALNIYGMKEGSEKVFGKGYNVLPIWKQRLNAKTLITTPNSDVIYALGYLDLKEDGPMVIEVPPGLQGILDDFWQRPIPSVGEIDGRKWSGDVGLAGPDQGKGGKYLVLPPDYTGDVPPGYFTFRSGTYGVFVFWRGFSRTRTNSQNRCGCWSRHGFIRSAKRQPPSRCSSPTPRSCRLTCFIRRTARRSICCPASLTMNTSILPTCICAAWRQRSAS